ncbi:hypothetical protein BY996DRAFT_6610861 [Phakopsora pachyrhizi]|nr:hypothetical protein BY996DRAFT_6610861 [Phakopsora pachyrhizi]
MSQFGKKVRVLGISMSRWVMLKRVERSGEEDEIDVNVVAELVAFDNDVLFLVEVVLMMSVVEIEVVKATEK